MRPARDSDFLDGCLTKPSRIMNEYKRLRAVPLRMALSKVLADNYLKMLPF